MAASFDVVALPAAQINDAITATSRAFWPDPLFGFFARTSLKEHKNMPVYVRAVIRDALEHGHVDAVISNGRIAATASWLPPGTAPRSLGRELLITSRVLPVLLRGRNRLTAINMLQTMDKKHPTEPHWYLALIGVDPAFQAKGIGNVLIRKRLDECDASGLPVYLETQKPENLPYYERFGFVVRDSIVKEGCPTLWSMWREPR